MEKPYMVCKIEHATVNVYYDHGYSAQYDDTETISEISKGNLVTSILEAIVYDTTGNVTGMDTLSGCLVYDAGDVVELVSSNDMILNANENLREKLVRIVQIYNHLNNNEG